MAAVQGRSPPKERLCEGTACAGDVWFGRPSRLKVQRWEGGGGLGVEVFLGVQVPDKNDPKCVTGFDSDTSKMLKTADELKIGQKMR